MPSSSGYQGKRWVKPQDRGGGGAIPKARGATPERDGKGESRESLIPFLNDISAINMERYIEAVHNYTLSSREHAILAPWIRGRIPTVMLEYELPRSKEKLLGLAAKHINNKDGTVASVSITAGAVRDILIKKTMNEDRIRRLRARDPSNEIGSSSMDAESNEKDSAKDPLVSRVRDSKAKTGSSSMDADPSSRDHTTEQGYPSSSSEGEMFEEHKEEALKSLFPPNAKKSREIERSQLQTSAAALLGLMVFAWPSKDIKIKMLATKPLVEAFENNDVISFLEELRAFSLAGSGNPDANREAAEKHLQGLIMKPNQILEYFKEFTEAVEHIRVCRSSFTEFRVVDLFFRHLDQDLFPQWHVKFLTDDDKMYRFQALKFEDAKEQALKYYDSVIRVRHQASEPDKKDGKRNQNNDNNNKSHPINNMRHLKAALADSASGPITVNPIVLATLISGNKRKADNKAKADAQKANVITGNKKLKVEDDKKICFNFRDTGKCAHGSNCYFAHTKAA